MQKVLATFYLGKRFYPKYEFIQNLETGETFVMTKHNVGFGKWSVQEFEEKCKVNLNDLLN